MLRRCCFDVAAMIIAVIDAATIRRIAAAMPLIIDITTRHLPPFFSLRLPCRDTPAFAALTRCRCCLPPRYAAMLPRCLMPLIRRRVLPAAIRFAAAATPLPAR